MSIKVVGFFMPLVVVVYACVKDNTPPLIDTKPARDVTILFYHMVNQELLRLDEVTYYTSDSTLYEVNDLQYFISGLKLHRSDGKWIDINGNNDIHYIDARISKTQVWNLKITAGDAVYDSVSFIFGLSEDNNVSNRFPDPPERDMFWPQVLGGGYHYLKMNLKWKNDMMNELMPFMFHIGIGQMYAGNSTSTDSIIGFIQNYFRVTLPFNGKLCVNSSSQTWDIIMNIEKWFDGTYAFDFSKYPMGIMQNQEGMHEAIVNGRNAFRFEVIREL